MNKQEELIARCKQGDPSAYTELYHEHVGAVYNSIIRLVRHTAEAEDILQESFVAAFQGIAGFTPTVGFRAWVKKIAINKSIDWIRKQKISFVELESHFMGISEDAGIDEAAFQYTMDAIAAAIELLPDHYRTIFNLYAIENIPHGEIAHLLGLENTTARTQYHRAKQKLLMILTKGG
ncbi:RNA polymerase sigma factor [Paraflavitalea soli]|uniref:RNA polymerase sigma factor n=1 Tax=Paraflavitalea soli TaxID=2315862 RepID=A0A3B7MST5_9BACT|nr:RNA polymerase sigma factor [Paraflavitalea soli]AXY74695.1 RNA polymerase sigma factor [Paraflavitalea soli]